MGKLTVVILLVLQGFSLVYNTLPSVDFDITCEEDQMTAHFSVKESEPAPNERTRVLTVKMLDTSCDETSSNSDGDTRGSTGTSGDDYQLNMTIKYDECDSIVHNLTDYIVINNTATLEITETLRGGKTDRVYYYNYHMSCVLDRDHNVNTSESSFKVDYNTLNITDEFEKVENFDFGFSLDFYTDDTFGSPHPYGEVTVNTNEYIYVKLKEENPNTHFKFVVTECAADKTKVYNPSTADIFFQDRCSLDPTFEIKSALSATDDFDFEIQAFTFVSEDIAVYFHCKIYICKTDSDALDCIQSCPSTGNRQRRDADGHVKEEIVRSRPIKFNRNVKCDDIRCPSNSECVPLAPARCICHDDYVFSRIEKRCVKERIVQIENIHINKEWNETYADPKHPNFLRLALKYEDILYKSFIGADATREIEGVRIIRASPGSIIFETRIIYGPSSTPQDAYNAFVRSITSKALDATTVRRDLQLLTDRTPAIVEIQNKMADIQKLILIIIVVVLLLVIVTVIVVIFVIRRNRKDTKKLDVDGIDNGGIEISKY